MRKALMGLILAATVMTPIAAEAQRGHRGDGEGSSSRSSSGRNAESRAARIEQRNEARQAQSESAPQQQAQPQQQQQQQRVVQRQHGGDGGNRGNWRGNNNQGNNNQGNANQGNNNQAVRGGWNRGDGDGNRRGRNSQPSIYPQTWQGNPNDPRLRNYQQLERRNQQQGYRRGDNRGNDGRNWRNNRNDGDTRRGDRRRGDWNRGWRNDRRYDWNGWRRGNRHRFHLSPYYSPYRSWDYSRFSIGFFLEPLFYDRRYWIGDPWQYRLPPAPYGTQWVRYYNDVLLVDIDTGEVVDTIYDFFW